MRYTPGQVIELGPLALSESEIMQFASLLDPQPVHTNPAYAQTTRFGGIIASGLHPYIAFHKQFWIPMVASDFICGLSIDGAQFFLPVYPDMPIHSQLHVLAAEPKADKGTVVVRWRWHFLDAQGQLLSNAAFTSYHHLPTDNLYP